MIGLRKLSIVCPVYNEEEVILDFHAELVRVVNELAARFDTEIIYVVDRCTDRTLDLLAAAAAADPRGVCRPASATRCRCSPASTTLAAKRW
jgi:glycosyltransferase involved in cell wall biosynthesis